MLSETHKKLHILNKFPINQALVFNFNFIKQLFYTQTLIITGAAKFMLQPAWLCSHFLRYGKKIINCRNASSNIVFYHHFTFIVEFNSRYDMIGSNNNNNEVRYFVWRLIYSVKINIIKVANKMLSRRTTTPIMILNVCLVSNSWSNH